MKKYAILIVFMTFVSFTFSQSKKEILKEIKIEKIKIISKATYNIEFKTLVNQIKQYLSIRRWSLTSRDSTIGGEKSRPYTCQTTSGYPAKTTYKKCYAKEFVSIHILQQQPGNYYLTSSSSIKKETCICFGGFTIAPIKSFYLISLQKYLFKLNKNEFILSNELTRKIENYNASQKKDRKKILKGKNY